MATASFSLLVAVDFSPESVRALAAARTLARRTDGAVTILHVRPLSDVRAAVVEGREDLLRGSSAAVRSGVIDHYEKRFAGLGTDPRREKTSLVKGRPGREICREAARGYDLLVLGTRGRGKVVAALLGSTVQEILSRSPIPVLVVPG